MGMVTVSANVKKILTVSVVVVLLYFVVSQPGPAAQVVQNGVALLQGWADAVVTFLQSLFA
jgi:hypothetical protein